MVLFAGHTILADYWFHSPVSSRRKVHCTPLYTKKNQVDTPVIGAWGMKDGSLVIKVYEIEMLEEDTLTLTPEEDGVQVKLVNTTIPSRSNEYISTVIQ